MEGISPQELRQQYMNLPIKPSIGFLTLWQNVRHLATKHILTNELLNASDTAFTLRCTTVEPHMKPKQLIVKCFIVSTLATLSSAVELFQLQQEISQISRTIEPYISYIYNSEDEMMNMIRPNLYRCSIDHIYRMNAISGIMNRFEQIVSWISQLLDAVSILHERGFLHGGIKPSNVFIDETTNEIRLVDVGFAVRLASLELQARDMDIYSATKPNRIVPHNDVHSLMVLLYQMTFGFDSTFSVIKQLESGTPFDETEQDNNPNENDETEFKYLMVKLINRVVCHYRGQENLSIFFISDVIHQKRSLEPLDSSPKHVAAALERTLPHSKALNAEPKSNSDGFVEPIDDIIEPMREQTKAPLINVLPVEFDQNELLRQELLYQQMQAELKMEKDVYAQKQISLQDKIDLYKKQDYNKYQQGSSPLPSSNNLRDSGEHHHNHSQAQIPQYSNTSEFQVIHHDQQLQQSPPKQPQLQQQGRSPSLHNKQNSVSFIDSSSQLPTHHGEPQFEASSSLMKIPAIEYSHSQNQLDVPSSQVGWQEELLRNLSNNSNQEKDHVKEHFKTNPDIQLYASQGSPAAPVGSVQQDLLVKKQETIDNHHHEDMNEERHQDEWVFDCSDFRHVQRGDDTRLAEYATDIPQSIQISPDQTQVNNNANYLSNNSLIQEMKTEQLTRDYSSRGYQQQQYYEQQAPILQEGEITLTHENGQLCYIGTMLDNKKHGRGRLYNTNGTVIYSGGFAHDEYEGFGEEFYDNGQKSHEGNYKNGGLSGKGRAFFRNGGISYDGEFEDGICHGEGAKYNERGLLLSIAEYQHGKLCGKITRFHENAVIEFSGFTKNNKREGNGTEYYPNGVVCFSGLYSKGKRVQGIQFNELGQKTYEGNFFEDDDE